MTRIGLDTITGRPRMIPANVMSVYDGTLPIGELEDHGRRRVLAFYLTANGRVPLGTFPDRRQAIRAVIDRHCADGGPQ